MKYFLNKEEIGVRWTYLKLMGVIETPDSQTWLPIRITWEIKKKNTDSWVPLTESDLIDMSKAQTKEFSKALQMNLRVSESLI